MRIGVIACAIMRRELTQALEKISGVSEVVFLPEGKHVDPRELKRAVTEQIEALKGRVDVIFLGYGYCNSLKGIGDEFDIPIIHPQAEDCIAILLSPERYAGEIAREAGTWFMTPGWAELGEKIILNDLDLAKYVAAGVDPKEMARDLFSNYTRGLYIDTGVGDNERFISLARKSCDEFGLRLETTVSQSTILDECLSRAEALAREQTTRP